MRTATPPMDPGRRALLAGIRAALPDDPAMEVSLYTEFGGELRRALVGLSRRLELPVPDADELDGLTFDACGGLRVVARWWRPDGGALPWVYGRDRLTTMLRHHAGPIQRPLLDRDLVEGAAAPAAAPDDPPAVVVLDRLVRARDEPVVRLFQDALARVVPSRDRELVLLYAQQQAAADPSPSHTVASLVGRQPDAVRQAFSRARRRLRSLAIADDGFRPLLALPLLAGTGPSRGQAA